jgi:hypothetical protein
MNDLAQFQPAFNGVNTLLAVSTNIETPLTHVTGLLLESHMTSGQAIAVLGLSIAWTPSHSVFGDTVFEGLNLGTIFHKQLKPHLKLFFMTAVSGLRKEDGYQLWIFVLIFLDAVDIFECVHVFCPKMARPPAPKGMRYAVSRCGRQIHVSADKFVSKMH